MLINPPFLIPDGNLSRAWGHALLRTLAPESQGLRSPLVVSIEEFDEQQLPVEVPAIRQALDSAIAAHNGAPDRFEVQPVEHTSQVIFPHMCWRPDRQRPAEELFQWYRDRVFPKLKQRCRANARGTYFLRMIDYKGAKGDEVKKVNQLGDIIDWHRQHKGRPPNKACQVVIRDPAKDHFGARSEFPCLQQVSFARHEDQLVVGAYYPTENIFERGYGNYLGLCRLGCFMAHELRLQLARVDVFVLQPRLDAPKTNRAMQTLAAVVQQELSMSDEVVVQEQAAT